MKTELYIPLVLREGAAPKLPVFGVEVEVLLDGEQSAGTIAIYRVTAAPGTGAPLHRHVTQDEMFHVLDGNFAFECDGTLHRLEPGDFARAPRGAAHAFTSVGPNIGRVLVVATPAGHEAFFRDIATAMRAGTFSPMIGAEICQKHDIELLNPADGAVAPPPPSGPFSR